MRYTRTFLSLHGLAHRIYTVIRELFFIFYSRQLKSEGINNKIIYLFIYICVRSKCFIPKGTCLGLSGSGSPWSATARIHNQGLETGYIPKITATPITAIVYGCQPHFRHHSIGAVYIRKSKNKTMLTASCICICFFGCGVCQVQSASIIPSWRC